MNFFEDNNQEQNNDEIQTPDVDLELPPVVAEDDSGNYAITSRSSNRNTYILLGICLLAIVGVFFAGFKHHKTDDSNKKDDPVSKLDVVLTKLVGIKDTGSSKELVNAFYELPGGKQVKLDELNKNPFILEQVVQEGDVETVQQVDRQKVLASELGALRLGTIMRMPDGNMCLINGTVYKPGDQVTESFRLKEINVDSVVLEAEDCECILEM